MNKFIKVKKFEDFIKENNYRKINYNLKDFDNGDNYDIKLNLSNNDFITNIYYQEKYKDGNILFINKKEYLKQNIYFNNIEISLNNWYGCSINIFIQNINLSFDCYKTDNNIVKKYNGYVKDNIILYNNQIYQINNLIKSYKDYLYFYLFNKINKDKYIPKLTNRKKIEKLKRLGKINNRNKYFYFILN